MFESVEFQTNPGKISDKELTLFALTTCSFCRKARAFLDEQGFTYNYLYMDKIDPELKKKMKIEFADAFDKRMSFPTLMIDGKSILTGFIRVAWEKELIS